MKPYKSLASTIKEVVQEAHTKLHPNQQKLDVHEPEKDKLTADDFKKLRAGKKEEGKDPIQINPKLKEEDNRRGQADYGYKHNYSVALTAQHVKQGIGIARDKRYAEGNMSGAVKAMKKIHPDLSKHPAVEKELQKQNEDISLMTGLPLKNYGLSDSLINSVRKAIEVEEGKIDDLMDKRRAAMRDKPKPEVKNVGPKKLADLSRRIVKGKSYGADYVDPEGADETKADLMKPEPKRKSGPQGTMQRRFNTKSYARVGGKLPTQAK